MNASAKSISSVLPADPTGVLPPDPTGERLYALRSAAQNTVDAVLSAPEMPNIPHGVRALVTTYLGSNDGRFIVLMHTKEWLILDTETDTMETCPPSTRCPKWGGEVMVPAGGYALHGLTVGWPRNDGSIDWTPGTWDLQSGVSQIDPAARHEDRTGSLLRRPRWCGDGFERTLSETWAKPLELDAKLGLTEWDVVDQASACVVHKLTGELRFGGLTSNRGCFVHVSGKRYCLALEGHTEWLGLTNLSESNGSWAWSPLAPPLDVIQTARETPFLVPVADRWVYLFGGGQRCVQKFDTVSGQWTILPKPLSKSSPFLGGVNRAIFPAQTLEIGFCVI